ncbi:bifunctional isocitrate dehydrogenase kinase/phosphatase [Planctobacterium marinum]|uniref:Isocitrate dehydrogenase kinase/phosphatase n=1 Tax=Planctobacterium marinum TaxID=1631968 RepID=A0AA48HTP1_9ALTE|nr:isocitrate dehydrogenase kinase/phosphatase [Planctobacterium marinum]
MSIKQVTNQQIAYEILKGFEKSFRLYNRITSDAKKRFETSKWRACQQASRDRISLYESILTETVAQIYTLFLPQQQSPEFWRSLKQDFVVLLDDHPQFELAETFYNSVIGRIFKHQRIDDSMMFVLPSRCYLSGVNRPRVINIFDTDKTVKSTLQQMFTHYRFNVPFENYQRDLHNLTSTIKARLSFEQLTQVKRVEMLQSEFFRGRAAYLVGRICFEDDYKPFVVALLMSEAGELYVDALLTEKRDLSVLFGFARAYFMVDTQYPAEVVAFLQELLPNKKHFELYTALGFYKHGKTVFYRNFLQHLEESDDQFEIAPGIRGLVMMCFHLPSYGVVIKIIKDEFAESKKITRQHVIDCYKLVKSHDRIGRMADTHEFANFRLPKHRIHPDLLQELQDTCGNSIEILEDEVLIKHLYIERKMTPLNIYLANETDPDKIRNAILDLGLAIKQIAAANIFPGDMLHKNFGITRHGRVIFYDYDEICYMSERNFRKIPQSDDPYAMDTLSVAPNDVFPEQFEHFIVGKRELKAIFKELHADLFTPEYWQNVQKQVANGDIIHVIPYPESDKFQR